MQRKLKKIYLINLIIFAAIIPLIVLLTLLLIKSAIDRIEVENAGEALVLPFIAMMIIVFYFCIAIICIAADLASLAIAIVCFIKMGRIVSKKQARKFAILSIIFIGNIVPGIMILKSKEEQFENNQIQQ